MWYVYALENKKKNFIYIGYTNDLKRRIREHFDGKTQSTKAYLPLRLSAYIAVTTEQKAKRLEKYFKTGSGKTILKKRIIQ
ncbi:MAG: GIY-YIG nuclease family protein [Candidatus Marinimicrobia bacterium]|nr:GIY-YIG nuclease family protein [Candidatus Neomarinimicrobiota bacterium]